MYVYRSRATIQRSGLSVNDASPQWSFTAPRLRARRSLAPLAALLGVVLVATAVIGLFGQYYGEKSFRAEARRIDALVDALDTARRAQVNFKVQVQEWKNILLRGDTGADLDRFRDAFRQRGERVAQLLGRLEAEPPDGLPGSAAADLAAAHRDLRARYETALAAGLAPGDGVVGDPRAVDRAVRGADRALDEALDAYADRIRDRLDTVRVESAAATAERYHAIYRASLIGLALCIVLAGAFVLVAMRREGRP